jgi:hypothetical protein
MKRRKEKGQMMRFRFLALIVLLCGALVPFGGLAGGVRPAHAAGIQSVWEITNQALDPAMGGTTYTDTFTPQSSTYLVDVSMTSADPGDTMRLLFGLETAVVVSSGEERLFVASHLAPPVPPVVSIGLDARHDYGGRMPTFSLAVYPVVLLPAWFAGTAASQEPNSAMFDVTGDGYFTFRYRLDSGSARILLSKADGTQQDSGHITASGSFVAHLSPGFTTLTLQQTPSTGLMHWRVDIGPAPAPAAGNFQPRNNAILSTSPILLSAAAAPGTHLLLDQKPLASGYDQSSARLTFRLNQPLAAGLHLLQVANDQGVPSSAGARFIVLPAATTAPSSLAGVFDGRPWVRTSTPDGRYSLLKPASWQILANQGSILLFDPRGAGFMVLSAQYLDHRVDARQVARSIDKLFAGHLKLTAPFQYSGTADSALFSGTVTSGHKTLLSQNLVLPDPGHYSLALAFGFGTPSSGSDIGATLARIESSLVANGDSEVRAAHRWLHFAGTGTRLDYPDGWLANLSGAGLTWFFDPATQGLIIALGQPSGNTTGVDAVTLGHKLQALLAANLHPGLRIVGETTQSSIAAAPDPVYRWLATYPGKDGKSQYLEYGQIVLGAGRWTAVWGDTTQAQAPVNLPLYLRSLNSAALAAGRVPPTPDTVTSLLQLASKSKGTNPAAPGTPSSTGSALQTLQQIDRQNEAFALASAAEQSRHLAIMATLGYTIEYVPDYGGY